MVQRFLALVFLFVLLGSSASPRAFLPEARFIVRTDAGFNGLRVVTWACALAGCTVQHGLDGPLNSLFLVTAPVVNAGSFAAHLQRLPGISTVELDSLVNVMAGRQSEAPPALLDDEPLAFFGTTVRGGYVRQPANAILGISTTHEQYGLTGSGVVIAVIDTGVDPSHPVLQPVLLEGHDFTRNRAGASERSDVDQSVMWIVDQGSPAFVNQSTMAMLDQSTMAMLDQPGFRAFGHGTMVAGVIHLVAPHATILPLKAFGPDGAGYKSDVLRAIYFGVRAGAKVLNMSFSFATPSQEVNRAIDHATGRGVVAVASVGNDGQAIPTYPAAWSNVIGVASTTDADMLSAFSNFGHDVAWVAAPGEGVITTYPFASYAAAWGTSFSTPFATGAAALLAQVDGQIDTTRAADAEGHAVWISPELDRGRLDIPAAVGAWRQWLGLAEPEQ